MHLLPYILSRKSFNVLQLPCGPHFCLANFLTTKKLVKIDQFELLLLTYKIGNKKFMKKDLDKQ